MGDPRLGWRWVGRCASRSVMDYVTLSVQGDERKDIAPEILQRQS